MSNPNEKRKINLAGIALIMHFESFSPTAYIDPVGKLTIGYGHTRNVAAADVINEHGAQQLLQQDLQQTQAIIREMITVQLTEAQFSALTCLAFNIGVTNFHKSTLLKQVNAGNLDEAASEFDRWTYGTVNGQKKQLPGLVRRRAAERELFRAEERNGQ